MPRAHGTDSHASQNMEPHVGSVFSTSGKTVRRLLDLDRSKFSVLNRKLKGQPPSYWEAVRLGR